nr:MAG TPA: hypothetical protein [Caudoviricetes sp.]
MEPGTSNTLVLYVIVVERSSIMYRSFAADCGFSYYTFSK